MKLKAQLPMLLDAFPVDNPYCNHVDFMWSTDVTKLVNDPIRRSLGRTDDPDWEYSEPDPRMKPVQLETVGRNEVCNVSAVADGQNFELSMDYMLDNLDAIIANTMPQLVDQSDVVTFKREMEMQKVVFTDLIRSAKDQYSRSRDSLVNGISDKVSAARAEAETQVKRAGQLIGDKVSSGGQLIGDKVSSAGQLIGDKVSSASKSVTTGLAKAEKSLADGVNKAERAVGNALKTSLNKVINVFSF